MSTTQQIFYVDPISSELPGVLSDVIKNPLEINVQASLPIAGGFSSTVGNYVSSYPGNDPINVYLTTAPTATAVNIIPNTVTFACPAPTVAGGLNTFVINMFNNTDYPLTLYITPCLLAGQNTGIVGNSNPVTVAPGANGNYTVKNTSTSTDPLSLKISLTSPLNVFHI